MTRPIPHPSSIPRAPSRAERGASAAVYARVFAASVAVEGLSAGLARRLRLLLKAFLAPPDERTVTRRLRVEYDARTTSWLLYEGAACLSHATTEDELLGLTEWFVIHWGVVSCADTLLIHGAALRRGDATLLLLGESGAGKTTLSLGLLARGWLPYGDDITPVDPTSLQVRPFPRCFHVDAATRELVAGARVLQRSHAAAGYAAPLRWASGSSRPTAVIVAGRDVRQPVALSAITRAEAAGALLHAAIDTPMPRGEVASVAARLAAAVAGCYRLNNVQLQATLDLLEAGAGSR